MSLGKTIDATHGCSRIYGKNTKILKRERARKCQHVCKPGSVSRVPCYSRYLWVRCAHGGGSSGIGGYRGNLAVISQRRTRSNQRSPPRSNITASGNILIATDLSLMCLAEEGQRSRSQSMTVCSLSSEFHLDVCNGRT